MALRCVRVATFTLLLISFALLLGQTTAHAKKPTPTERPTRTPAPCGEVTCTPNPCDVPKPGHGPLSLSSHAAPVANCVARCRCNRGPETTLGDFLACVAICTHPPNTRKPTNTARPTSTPGGVRACCQCPPITGDTAPFCLDTLLVFDCEQNPGCVPLPFSSFRCDSKSGMCVPRPTRDPHTDSAHPDLLSMRLYKSADVLRYGLP